MIHPAWVRTVFKTATVMVAALCAASALGQVTATSFTYQGRLVTGAAPASGLHDFRFRLYDQPSGGAPLGVTQCRDNVTVSSTGEFAVSIDFGEAFAGPIKYLEIEVRADGGLTCIDATGFVLLNPRQPVSSTPRATHALSAVTAGSASTATTATSATTASNATNLNGQAASFYTNAGNLSTGTISDARLSGNIATLNGTQTFSAAKSFTLAPIFNAPSAPFVVNSTTRVDNLNADLLDGLNSTSFAAFSHTHDGAAITTGTVADARLSSNIPRLNTSNAFTGTGTFAGNLGAGTASPTGRVHIADITNLPATIDESSFAPFKIGSGSGTALLMDANQIESAAGPLFLNARSSPAARDVIIGSGGGRVGLRNGAPATAIEMNVAVDQSFRLSQDGPVPGITVNSPNSGALAGIMRLRNAIEIWPSADGTRAGKVDVRNTNGDPAITLDGATGDATYRNQTAAAFAQTYRDPRPGLGVVLAPGAFVNLEQVTPMIPGAGLVILTATVNVNAGDLPGGGRQEFFLKIEDFTNANPVQLLEVGGAVSASFNPDSVSMNSVLTATWVVPVDGPGERRFRSVLTNALPAQIRYFTTTLSAVYVPRGM